MKAIIILCSCLLTVVLQAQSTTGAAGASFGNIQFTIGEPIIETLTDGDTTVLQGYHQPTITISSVPISEIENWSVLVFPNPSEQFVQVQWNTVDVPTLQYVLYDIQGKAVFLGKSKVHFQLDISEQASGNYYLSLTDEKNQSQIFNIQKIK